MISVEAVLNVIDNSGARKVKCIKALGGAGRKYCSAGDVIIVAIQEIVPNSKMKKGSVHPAVITTTKYPIKGEDGGSYTRFSENTAVILNANHDLIGTRIFSPVSNKVRQRFTKIASLAPLVI